MQRAADGTAERVIGSIRDVTSEHLLEERLRQAQKMEAVGQLAGGVAHDFNNLLTVIGGHVFMLEQASADAAAGSGEPDPRSVKHLAGITRAADRAASLTRQLLAFGRKQLLSPTMLDVNAVVEETLHMMRPAVGERIEIVTRLEPNLRPVYADAGQLGRVLVNLGLNARDAMQSTNGGTLTIETANATLTGPRGAHRRRGVRRWRAPRRRLRATDAAGYRRRDGRRHAGARVRAVLHDEAARPRHGSRPRDGVRHRETVIRRHPRGERAGVGIDVHDSPPRAGASTHAAKRHARRRGPAPWTSVGTATTSPHRGVLLVEDDAGVLAFATEVLSRAGYDVRSARHGVEALEQMRKHEASIDIVVTDVVMPEMGGRPLVEQLRKRRPHLPVSTSRATRTTRA